MRRDASHGQDKDHDLKYLSVKSSIVMDTIIGHSHELKITQ